MERILNKETVKYVNKKVMVSGWVNVRRDHGKIIFLDLRDRSGILQVVFTEESKDYKKAEIIKPEYVVSITGKVAKRPLKMVNKNIETGKVELQGQTLEILSEAETLPIEVNDKNIELQLDTLLDNRPLTIRTERNRKIFKVFETVLKAYAEKMRDLGFTEIKTPKILGAATEGGANFFTLDYFGRKAFLAQSPQFYKQIMVGAFERVFEIDPVFRAEKHFTTRHMNEYISLDAEIGFIKSFEDITNTLTEVIRYIFDEFKKRNAEEMKFFKLDVPKVPKRIPMIKLKDVKKIIGEKYNYKISDDTDIDPQGERLAGEYAKEKYNSDFIFLTHYPKNFRPFYTMPSKDGVETEGFDLLFKGLEIATGSQRIHQYKDLVESIKRHKLNPEDFSFYLQTFKYGMPPHGGWGMGLERIVYKILNLSNVKEACLFPRDVRRIIP